jgi:excisionase family DNA binding protein
MSGEWVNLSEAAELLGVHPSTVRQWADRGELLVQRTSGGHRRFRRAEVAEKAAGKSSERSHQAGTQLIIQTMVGRARLGLIEGLLQDEAWYQRLDDAARRELGQIGHRLLGLMQRYLAAAEPEEHSLAEAQEIGRQYRRLGQKSGLALVDITRAYLYFREFMAETMYDIALTAGVQSVTDWGELRRRVIHLTNEVLLALVDIDWKDPLRK